MTKKEFMKKINKEQSIRLLRIQSEEELLALAKEFDVVLTLGDVANYMLKLTSLASKNEELSDEEIEIIAGGGDYKEDYLLVSNGYFCNFYKLDSSDHLGSDKNYSTCHDE